MENGRLVEEGDPYDLLTRETIFRDIIREHGKEFEKKMLKCAKNKELDVFNEISLNESRINLDDSRIDFSK